MKRYPQGVRRGPGAPPVKRPMTMTELLAITERDAYRSGVKHALIGLALGLVFLGCVVGAGVQYLEAARPTAEQVR